MIRRTDPPVGGPTPPTPAFALVPGAVLTFLGVWAVAEGEFPLLGLALLVVGVAFLLTGAIAKGVAWGLDLHITGED
jgi:hypothetical protein